MRDNILIPISEGSDEVTTFNPATITNTNNSAEEYIGEDEGYSLFMIITLMVK